MDTLLELAFNHKTEWRYESNADKTVAMIWDASASMNILFCWEMMK